MGHSRVPHTCRRSTSDSAPDDRGRAPGWGTADPPAPASAALPKRTDLAGRRTAASGRQGRAYPACDGSRPCRTHSRTRCGESREPLGPSVSPASSVPTRNAVLILSPRRPTSGRCMGRKTSRAKPSCARHARRCRTLMRGCAACSTRSRLIFGVMLPPWNWLRPWTFAGASAATFTTLSRWLSTAGYDIRVTSWIKDNRLKTWKDFVGKGRLSFSGQRYVLRTSPSRQGEFVLFKARLYPKTKPCDRPRLKRAACDPR